MHPKKKTGFFLWTGRGAVFLLLVKHKAGRVGIWLLADCFQSYLYIHAHPGCCESGSGVLMLGINSGLQVV